MKLKYECEEVVAWTRPGSATYICRSKLEVTDYDWFIGVGLLFFVLLVCVLISRRTN